MTAVDVKWPLGQVICLRRLSLNGRSPRESAQMEKGGEISSSSSTTSTPAAALLLLALLLLLLALPLLALLLLLLLLALPLLLLALPLLMLLALPLLRCCCWNCHPLWLLMRLRHYCHRPYQLCPPCPWR